jgi:hypothetical protein
MAARDLRQLLHRRRRALHLLLHRWRFSGLALLDEVPAAPQPSWERPCRAPARLPSRSPGALRIALAKVTG